MTILIYKNFFGPLGYSASAYVMVGPERYHHLRFGACIFSWSENTSSERLRIAAAQLPFRINREALPIIVYLLYRSSKPLHRESWVQRNRNGFQSRTARVHLKEDMDEETSEEGKERYRKALQSFAKEFGRGVRQQRTRDQRKSWYTSTYSEYVQRECVGTWRSRSAERGLRE